jgi:hypothetical protein
MKALFEPVVVLTNVGLSLFSPSGKLVQIEYALNAVNAGATSLGIKGTFLPDACPA